METASQNDWAVALNATTAHYSTTSQRIDMGRPPGFGLPRDRLGEVGPRRKGRQIGKEYNVVPAPGKLGLLPETFRRPKPSLFSNSQTKCQRALDRQV